MNKNDFLNSEYLNLRGTPCPVNFIRSSLAAEKLNEDNCLRIDLDRGEPEEMVLSGLRNAGLCVKIILEEIDWVRLQVTISAR